MADVTPDERRGIPFVVIPSTRHPAPAPTPKEAPVAWDPQRLLADVAAGVRAILPEPLVLEVTADGGMQVTRDGRPFHMVDHQLRWMLLKSIRRDARMVDLAASVDQLLGTVQTSVTIATTEPWPVSSDGRRRRAGGRVRIAEPYAVHEGRTIHWGYTYGDWDDPLADVVFALPDLTVRAPRA